VSQVAAVTALACCRGVSVVHGDGSSRVAALTRVDFRVESGEFVSLFGASGSGKTTLLHVLGGLLVPVEGEVLWRGAALSTLDASARAARRAGGIAFVFQGANLLPNFSAYENIAFAAHASSRAAGPAVPPGDPAELLTLVGLSAKLDALPAELSGGEAQRVAIARALAQRPDLLLCDEPTGHLDSDTGARVLDLIEALQTEFGFALVIATHDLDIAARTQRAVGLSDGRISSEERFS
jgi:putative ABC transport system ATP-binding protein